MIENDDDPDTTPDPENELTSKERRAQRKAAREAVRTSAQTREAMRKKVRMFYDLQRLRIQAGGRGKPRAEGTEIALHEADIAVLDARSQSLLRAEKDALADIADQLLTVPLYQKVLSDKARFKGLGPTLAGVIIAEIDITTKHTASTLWSFAGLAPVPARRCGRCHFLLTDKGEHEPYRGKKVAEGAGKEGEEEKKTAKPCEKVINPYDSGKAMRPTKGEKLPYNAFLKTKLLGVLGPNLLKAKSPWTKFYYDYKHRKASAGWGKSDGHRHEAAMRYMVKMLLLEIWKEWRTLEGLEVRVPYQEQYLGHAHAG